MKQFLLTSESLMLAADGISPVQVWDGYATSFVDAGVYPPTTQPTLAGSGVGTITGDYQAYVRFVDSSGNVSNLSPASAVATLTSNDTVDFSDIEVPTQATVVRRQILRNTAGQFETFYVDIDTSDLVSTTFQSTKDDATLRAQEAVPLFDSDGNDAANIYTVPPDYKPFMAWHQNRMYYAGVRPYTQGSVQATSGSAIVLGNGTEWGDSLAGRLIYIDGADQAYEVDSVNTSTQSIALTQPYLGTSVRYAAYSIRPAAIEGVTFYYSLANNAVAVPATNAYTIPQDGDEVTGVMNFQSFLYFLKTSKMYRLTTRVDPTTDGRVYLGISRGCVNNQCWVVANEVAYLLDEGGVYAFRGDSEGETATAMIQDVFRRDGFGSLQINWTASENFHASHSPQEEVIRWFVCIGGDTLPRHALAYGYTTRRWWVEEYQHPIGASCLGRSAGLAGTAASGSEQSYLGSFGNRIYALVPTGLDGVVAATAVRAEVLSSAPWTATLIGQSLTSAHVGATAAVARGRARGQVRRIAEVSGSTLRVDRPWDVLPDRGDVIQVGGVPIEWIARRQRYTRDEKMSPRQVEVNYYPVPTIPIVQTLGVAFYDDYVGPKSIGRRMDAGLSRGVIAAKGATRQEIRLDQNGYQTLSIAGGAESQTQGPKSVLIGLDGVSGPARVRINSLVVAGLVR